MPIETEKSAPGKLPGISVSQAFDLPEDWTLASSLKGEAADPSKKLAVEPTKGEGTPDPDELDKQKAAEKQAEKDAADKEKSSKEDATVDDDKKEAADAEKARKAKETAAAQKKADDAAGKKPAPKPEDKKPDAKPAEIPPLTKPKIKVGDKEFTEDEISKLIEGKKVEEKKVEPAPAAKTPEQLAADTAAQKKTDEEWISKTAQTLETPLDEATLDTILSGGKDAVAAMQEIRKRDMATTLLGARKDLLKVLEPALNAVNELYQSHQNAENARMENQLWEKFPDLKAFPAVVRQHAKAIVEAEPDKVAHMTEVEFGDYVAEQSVAYIRQFRPDFGQAAADPAAAAAAAAKPAVPAAAKPAVPARVTPKPPAGSTPGGSPSAGGKGGDKDFQKAAVATLL